MCGIPICPRGQPSTWESAEGARTSYLADFDHEPALLWLEGNANPAALASNRFGETKNAIEFVRKLLEAGWEEVYVASLYTEEWRITAEGGPYADALILLLPENGRERIFKIASEEAVRESFDPEPDIGQRELFLWWD